MNDKQNIQNLQNFAEVEFMIDQYFDKHLQKLVDKGYKDLRDKQSVELAQSYKEKSSRFMADPRIAMQQAMIEVNNSGEWNTKHTEDLVKTVEDKIYNNKSQKEDITSIMDQWRACVVARLGQARYDQLSKEAGGDLAAQYMASRINEKIFRRLAKLGAPKSTLEYVFTTGIKETFVGFLSLSSVPSKSQSEGDLRLEQEQEALFSDKARNTGRAIGFVGDMLTPGVGLGGKAIKAVISAGAKGIAKTVAMPAADLALRTHIYSGMDEDRKNSPNYTKNYSKAIFGDERALTELRTSACTGVTNQSTGVNIINSTLNYKVLAKTTDNAIVQTEKNALIKLFNGNSENAMAIMSDYYKEMNIKVSDAKPAPGWMAQKSEDFLITNAAYYTALTMEMKRKGIGSKMIGNQMMTLQEVAQKGYDYGRACYDKQLAVVNKMVEQAKEEERAVQEVQARQVAMYQQQQQQQYQAQQLVQQEQVQVPQIVKPTKENIGGWNSLIEQFGLKGFGDLTNNMGYVLSMLPDMLLGMFTGQTKSVHLKDNMFPIAAIIAGIFVKNPLLKMLLIGLGGANLLNKAGHEYMERDGLTPAPRQVRTYDDEPLDVRIGQPVMKGRTLVASIDGVPNVITIDDATAAAYEDGKIPLNTLCNAILRKYDAQRAEMSRAYEKTRSEQEEETIYRGIR
ncbi:MAG: hypothetical protein IJ647_05365 [Prevotella sp.]|nr:hypothetical protein [Prevotella sp.]